MAKKESFWKFWRDVDWKQMLLFIVFIVVLTNIIMYLLGLLFGNPNLPISGASSGVIAYYVIFQPELVYGKKFAKKYKN